MTSEERKVARYVRRKAAREKRKREILSPYDDFNNVFSYDHLYASYKKCRRNVGWKSSTQKYITQAPLMVWQTYQRLHNGQWKSGGFYEFDIHERGKLRHIRSVTMAERVVQRCLCDYALVPALSRTFIYDNGASLENKGYHFSLRRLCQHLREHYRKFRNDGYILLFDFSKFFDNVSHAVCKSALRRKLTDKKLIALSEHFIDMFGDVGLGLGSQISQIFALASANKLDHFIKYICGIKGYGRYMDDGYVIHRSKEFLKRLLVNIEAICKELGIVLNQKKTHIVKLSHGFTYLKARIFLTSTGKVVKKIPKTSVVRERRKLKKLRPKYLSGVMTAEDIRASWQSWLSYANNFKAFRTVRNMRDLYAELFPLKEKNKKKECTVTANVKTYSLKKDGNVKLSANFAVREFRCNDGSDGIKIDLDNVKTLQKIRDHFGKSVKITSAYRTSTYNAKIGGAKSSYHTKGMATDIVIDGVNARRVALYAESIGSHGVIWYPLKKFTHVDCRPGTYHAICVGSAYYPEPTMSLKKGDNNMQVGWMQYMLRQLGYNVATDGVFGSGTVSAVKDFQKKHGLSVDGTFGAKTRAKLKEALM